MSLVGPRPLPAITGRPRRSAEYLGQIRRAPGLTGLWQVTARSTLGTLEMLRLDLLYIRNRTLRRDLVILLRTVPALLRGGGAR